MHLEDNEQKMLVSTLPKDLALSEDSFVHEEDFLRALSVRVAYLMSYNSGVFFQLLYKMDVLEHKLKGALLEADVPWAIAQLILERQKEKIAARKAHPATQAKQDDELRW